MKKLTKRYRYVVNPKNECVIEFDEDYGTSVTYTPDTHTVNESNSLFAIVDLVYKTAINIDKFDTTIEATDDGYSLTTLDKTTFVTAELIDIKVISK